MNSSTPTVSHEYTTAASHVASVTVTDKEGSTATATLTIKSTS
jgi:hypothetical protein